MGTPVTGSYMVRSILLLASATNNEPSRSPTICHGSLKAALVAGKAVPGVVPAPVTLPASLVMMMVVPEAMRFTL